MKLNEKLVKFLLIEGVLFQLVTILVLIILGVMVFNQNAKSEVIESHLYDLRESLIQFKNFLNKLPYYEIHNSSNTPPIEIAQQSITTQPTTRTSQRTQSIPTSQTQSPTQQPYYYPYTLEEWDLAKSIGYAALQREPDEAWIRNYLNQNIEYVRRTIAERG